MITQAQIRLLKMLLLNVIIGLTNLQAPASSWTHEAAAGDHEQYIQELEANKDLLKQSKQIYIDGSWECEKG